MTSIYLTLISQGCSMVVILRSLHCFAWKSRYYYSWSDIFLLTIALVRWCAQHSDDRQNLPDGVCSYGNSRRCYKQWTLQQKLMTVFWPVLFGFGFVVVFFYLVYNNHVVITIHHASLEKRLWSVSFMNMCDCHVFLSILD